jgi:hypothetical protein
MCNCDLPHIIIRLGKGKKKRGQLYKNLPQQQEQLLAQHNEKIDCSNEE